MMRLEILTATLLFIVCLSSSGQETDSTKDNGVTITLDRPSRLLGDPLFILSVDNKKAEFTKSELFQDSVTINPDWILSINVIKGQEATAKYGVRGQYGAILIDLKKDSFDKLTADIKAKFQTKN